MLDSLDRKFGDAEKYSDCLARVSLDGVGHPILGPDDATLALTEMLPDPRELPSSTNDPNAQSVEWRALLSAERTWEEADWECRQEVYSNHLDEVASAVDQFASVHAADIAVIRVGWSEILENASKLGFDGSYGSIEAQ